MKIETVYVEIINTCNLDCSTCYNSYGTNVVAKEMSVQQFEYIIHKFRPYGLRRVLISGGEPSLHSHFDSILQLIDSNEGLTFGIVTNGTINNISLINAINTRKNLTTQISLDGSTDEINALTRGQGNYLKVIQFLRSISMSPSKKFLKMVISKNNVHDIEDFYSLALSFNCIPEFSFVYKSGKANINWSTLELSTKQKADVHRQINMLNKKRGINAFFPSSANYCPFTHHDINTLCLSICIKVDGNIQPCHGLYRTIYSIGNAFYFDEMIFEKKLKYIIYLAKQRMDMNYGCSKCVIKNICGRGCIANAINLYDDPMANDGDCLLRKIELFSGFYE